MAAYDSMYKKIFNAVTDAINILQQAQKEAEEIFISQEEKIFELVQPKTDENGGDDDA